MKKVSLILALILCVSIMAIPALAEKPGEEVTVTFTLDQNNIGFVQGTLNYDSTVLTLKGDGFSAVDGGIAVGGYAAGGFMLYSGNNFAAVSGASLPQTLFKVTFVIAAGAEPKDYPVTIDVAAAFNSNDTPGTTTATFGAQKVTVDGEAAPGDRVPGDADGNGTVNLKDAALTLRFYSGWDLSGQKFIEANADVDGTAGISLRDAAYILRYYSGWGVELK